MSGEAGAASTTTDASNQAPTDPGLGGPLNQTADPIDRVVRIAPKWTIFVLAACGFLVLAAIIWAFAGEITGTVSSPGILKDNGYLGLSTDQAGQVKSVAVSAGDEVTEGQTLVEFATGDPLVAPRAGTVAAVYVASGSQVQEGSVLLAITDPDVPDVVYTVLPSSEVGTVLADMPVEMDVSSAPATTYGYLQGRVLEVSSTPMTTKQIAETLGLEPEIVMQALGTEPGLLATVGVTPNVNNTSHYQWTVGSGPDFLISQGTEVAVKVILTRQAPIRVVFPASGSASGAGQ